LLDRAKPLNNRGRKGNLITTTPQHKTAQGQAFLLKLPLQGHPTTIKGVPRTFAPLLALILFSAPVMAGCIFGGGGKPSPSLARPNSIPTATPPASLPVPILLGQSQAAGLTTPIAGTASGGNTYTLQSGDTLLVVAGKLNIPPEQQAQWVADVLRLNNIPDPTLIKAGQVLNLTRLAATPRPTGTVAAATARPGASVTPVPTSRNATPQPTTPASATTAVPTQTSGGGGTYTVVSGDSPVAIAQKLGVPVAQQQAWANQLVSLNNTTATGLQVGQVLQLPPIPR
jgi:LysM repeat protein